VKCFFALPDAVLDKAVCGDLAAGRFLNKSILVKHVGQYDTSALIVISIQNIREITWSYV
jgi:hypothetical protein